MVANILLQYLLLCNDMEAIALLTAAAASEAVEVKASLSSLLMAGEILASLQS
jgi:hypothetical protein